MEAVRTIDETERESKRIEYKKVMQISLKVRTLSSRVSVLAKLFWKYRPIGMKKRKKARIWINIIVSKPYDSIFE